MLAEIDILSIEIAGTFSAVVLLLFGTILFRKRGTKQDRKTGAYSPQVKLSKEDIASSLSSGSINYEERLGKTRSNFSTTLAKLKGKSTLDPSFWVAIEEMLLLGDVGIKTTEYISTHAQKTCDEQKTDNAGEAIEIVKETINSLLSRDRAIHLDDSSRNVWLFVGVNGVGKTTSIAKIARKFNNENKSVLLVAGDTFRAAAADQLEKWALKLGVEIVRSGENADPASVVFDGMEKANAKNFDLVLVDTAGRLHTKSNLMEEIKKIRRVIERTQNALKEVLIVIDASTGQNGLVQAREFSDALGITGVVLTKLDGSSKGGIVLAIEHELGIPVKWVGLGESETDLVPFDPANYVNALMGD